MIFCLHAYEPKDIFVPCINVFGEKDEIWKLWWELKEKYVIYIWNNNHFRVNPEKGIRLPEMNNKETNEYDKQQLKNFNIS